MTKTLFIERFTNADGTSLRLPSSRKTDDNVCTAKGPGRMTLPTGGKVNKVPLVVFAANSVGRKIHLGDSRVALAKRESRSPIGRDEGVSGTEVGEQGGVEDEGVIDEEIGDNDW